ncbi:hypothetical protein EON64_02945 [archaeon]|nr:MAG: hypothetical protein EON64_02945 [archaeon]
MTSDAKGLIGVIDGYKDKLSRLEEQLQAKQKAYHEMKSSLAKIKAVEVDLLMEHERLVGECKEEQSNVTLYKREVQQLHAVHLQEQRELLQAVASALSKSDSVSSQCIHVALLLPHHFTFNATHPSISRLWTWKCLLRITASWTTCRL